MLADEINFFPGHSLMLSFLDVTFYKHSTNLHTLRKKIITRMEATSTYFINCH